MPLNSQIHNDKPLENISVAYANQSFIANMLSPQVPVKHETDEYYVYSKDSLIIPDTKRADGAEAKEASFSLSTASYSVDEHSLRDLITDRKRQNADPAINLEKDTTEYLTEKIMMRKEFDLLTTIGTKANWAQEYSLTSTFAWNANTTLSNPIDFALSAGSTIAKNSGHLANVCAVDYATFLALKKHVSIVDRIKYTSAESISEGLIARLFEVDKLLVSRAVYNANEEGMADSMTFMMTDCAWFGYVEQNPGLKKASALYTFVTTNANNSPMSVKKWREDKRGGDMVEVSHMYDHKIVASDCAFYIGNTIQ